MPCIHCFIARQYTVLHFCNKIIRAAGITALKQILFLAMEIPSVSINCLQQYKLIQNEYFLQLLIMMYC